MKITRNTGADQSQLALDDLEPGKVYHVLTESFSHDILASVGMLTDEGTFVFLDAGTVWTTDTFESNARFEAVDAELVIR